MRARLLILLLTILIVSLTGCGIRGFSGQTCPVLPSITDYSPEFNAKLADQIRTLCKDEKYTETCQALKDFYKLRQELKAVRLTM